jgi:uncharacterized membrane protein YgcG
MSKNLSLLIFLLIFLICFYFLYKLQICNNKFKSLKNNNPMYYPHSLENFEDICEPDICESKNKPHKAGWSKNGSSGDAVCNNNPSGSPPYVPPHLPQPNVPSHIGPPSGRQGYCNPNLKPEHPSTPPHLLPPNHPNYIKPICVNKPNTPQGHNPLPYTLPPNNEANGKVKNESLVPQTTCNWKRICNPMDILSEDGSSGDSPSHHSHSGGSGGSGVSGGSGGSGGSGSA